MVYFVTGEKNQGKTSFLIKMYNLLEQAEKGYPDQSFPGSSVDGFVTVKEFSGGEFAGYSLKHLKTGKKIPFISFREKKESGFRIVYEKGPFVFYKEGLDFGERIVNRCLENGIARIFIDEVGKIELEENLFFPVLMKILGSNSWEKLFLGVRKDFIFEIIAKFNIKNYQVIECSQKISKELIF